MENERGRKTSQGAQQISPAPSPHQYDDATAGMDPSATFSTDSFGTDQQSYTFAQTQDSQPFMTDFTLSQISNPYLNSMDPSFNPAFVVPSNNFADAYPSQFATNQFETDQNNVNPADLSKISSPENHSPRLLSPDNLLHSGPQSPASTSGQFQTPQHSRNTSLDPSSAYHTADWTYRHQRSPSDVSDRSSVNNSPYNQHVDIDGHPSPLMAGQDTNTFGLDSININESHSQPGSAYHSPRLIPVQDGLGIDQNAILASQYSTGQELFPDDMYQMHNRHESVASDIGQADQFVPPTINIEPAPVSRQASFGPNGEILTDTLSPTSNSGRGRIRAQSDVTFTRPMGSRSVSPGRSNRESLSVRSPSPGGGSRSSSPGVSDGRISKDRRASTSAINNNNREYILDLADPNRPNGGQSGGSTRVQKHPATFQCNLCPKRFTRAYNLRSHLRTHTDERPFVCTVCSKAFARQHDRKRHEGLHSGEKKFVCKGELNSNPGQAWGCGRRFARADALGRHFRSEAGRVCIKPLLEEEAAERRQKAMMEAQQQAMLQPVPQPIMTDPTMGFTLPAALMTQYPQLATINWAALQSQADDDPGELSDIGIGGGYDDGLDAGGISDSGTYGHTSVWG